jgi:hypothetical protein
MGLCYQRTSASAKGRETYFEVAVTTIPKIPILCGSIQALLVVTIEYFMGWEELQHRLTDAFTMYGVVGYRICHVIEYEKAYGAFIERTYKGHSILSLSFQEFYTDTIEAALSVCNQEDGKPTPPRYLESVLWHLGNFRNIRAVDILFHNGYPMDGLARLRHLKESAIFLDAMLSGLTTYSRIKGWDGVVTPGKKLIAKDMELIRKNRMQEEKRILGLMLRKSSGLADTDIAKLEKWENYFHEEVHGAFLTQVLEHGPAIRGEDTISVAPKPHECSCFMFMNRFCEVAWMLHRTLPIMQLSTHRFGSEWADKWKLIDDNFFVLEKSIAEMGKSIGDIFIRFMEMKFPFDSETCFDTFVK